MEEFIGDFEVFENSITRYVGDKSEVEIPSILGENKIISVSAQAFADCTSVEKNCFSKGHKVYRI